jgi:quercetin 2,3-dioxygenase
MKIRYAKDRGTTRFEWLNSAHSFSFGQYYDPRFNGHGPLIVLNDDKVAAHSGFGTHGHKNMEIFTFMLAGELTHNDSLGHKTVLRPGDLQLMSAGTGIRHSEMNHTVNPVHFLQIWLEPNVRNNQPVYQQINRAALNSPLLVGPQGSGAPLIIQQNARIYFYDLHAEPLPNLNVQGEYAYLHIFSGELRCAGQTLGVADAILLQRGESLDMQADDVGFLWFDML